jgi:lipopolysaccharide transport system permease protein
MSQKCAITSYTSGPAARHPLAAIWAAVWELWEHREMTWILFCRDLKASFRGSLLGYVWLFLPPLATTLVWIVLNRSQVVKFSDPTIPYPLFVLVGTVVWSTFTRAVMLPLQIFQTSKSIFSKIKIPVGAFLLVAPMRALFDASVYAFTAALVLPFFDAPVSGTVFLFPVALVAAVVLGFALALVLLPASALYSDVQQALVLIFSVAMYLAPVVYPAPKTGLFAKFIAWNPVTPLIVSARDWIFHGHLSSLGLVLAVSGSALVVIALALAGLRLAMPHLTARMGM